MNETRTERITERAAVMLFRCTGCALPAVYEPRKTPEVLPPCPVCLGEREFIGVVGANRWVTFEYASFTSEPDRAT